MLCSIVPQPEFFNRTILERLLIIKNELLTIFRFQRCKGYFCVFHNSLRKIKIPGHYKVITERTRHLIRYVAEKLHGKCQFSVVDDHFVLRVVL